MGWTLQRSRRARGWYFQAVHGLGKERVALTLGYLSDVEEAAARERIGSMAPPDELVSVAWDREGETPPPPSKAAQIAAARSWLLDTSAQEALELLEETARAEAQRKIARGDYSGLTLREFRRDIWLPVRKREAAASTIRAEEPYWKAILEQLGGIKMKELTLPRWSAFLASRTSWGGRSQALAQNAYRQCLKYAMEIGAIKESHAFRAIKGSTKPTLPAAEPLTMEEVEAVLAAAPSKMHRALFGFAIGEGLRPGEAVLLRWEDIDWGQQLVRIRGGKTDRSDAVIPLLPLAERPLRILWDKLGRPSQGRAFVWNGTPVKEWKKSWKTTCRNAGITRRVFPNLARHTFATLALASGANPESVRQMMRHAKHSTILEQAYLHMNPSQIRVGMEPFARDGDDHGDSDDRGDSDDN